MISTVGNAFKGGSNLAAINAQGYLVSNATTLRHDEQKQYDTALIQVARKRLRLSNLLRGKGLVRNLGGLGTILSLYEQAGDFTAAKISMSGRTRADQDTLTFTEVGVPIPIFHKEFELDARRLAASRNGGTPLDTSSIEIATRIVADEWESHLYNGAPNIVVGGSTVYGLTTHPSRNTGSITSAWATGANVITDVTNMITALRADNMYGPYVLVVAKNLWPILEQDYSAAKGDNTVLERILQFVDISDVIPGDYLTNGNVVMFNADTQTVDLAIGQDMDSIAWTIEPMSTEFKVFMAGAIRIKADKGGNCGVAHWS